MTRQVGLFPTRPCLLVSAAVFRFTLVGILDGVDWPVPTGPNPASSHHPAEGQRQEISDEPGNAK